MVRFDALRKCIPYGGGSNDYAQAGKTIAQTSRDDAAVGRDGRFAPCQGPEEDGKAHGARKRRLDEQRVKRSAHCVTVAKERRMGRQRGKQAQRQGARNLP